MNLVDLLHAPRIRMLPTHHTYMESRENHHQCIGLAWCGKRTRLVGLALFSYDVNTSPSRITVMASSTLPLSVENKKKKKTIRRLDQKKEEVKQYL
jgi:hypothetical protein